METRIFVTAASKRSEAYIALDHGEFWGPLWPYSIHGKTGPDYRAAEMKQLGSGKTVDSEVGAGHGCTKLTPSLNAGEYHPRLWRSSPDLEQFGEAVPMVENTPFFAGFLHSLEQIEGLMERLGEVFRVVHGASANLEVYGSAIREILILACTEVESQWKGILVANGVAQPDDVLKTNHYVKLTPVMKLHDYEVGMLRYPHIQGMNPFSGWNASKPTQSLPWYDAYNKIKHDREANFSEAKLYHAIEAVAGCVVMLAAQFGIEALQRHQLKRMFEFRKRPSWGPEEWYYGPLPTRPWITKNRAM